MKQYDLSTLRIPQLQEIIDKLSEPDIRFDISDWYSSEILELQSSLVSLISVSETDIHTCGTTACIAGYAAITPSWIRESRENINSQVPYYQGHLGPRAFAEFLHISKDLAESITIPGYDDKDFYGIDEETADSTPEGESPVSLDLAIQKLTELRDEAIRQQANL